MQMYEIGDRVFYKQQPYRCVEIRPHRRRDGDETFLAVFSSDCLVCGQPFTLTTSVGVPYKFSPNRTCPEHHGQAPRQRRRKTWQTN